MVRSAMRRERKERITLRRRKSQRNSQLLMLREALRLLRRLPSNRMMIQSVKRL